MTQVEKAKQDKTLLISELKKAGAVFKGNSYTCVHHDDKRPSAGVFEGDAGWRFKCAACGATGDVWDIIAMNSKRDVADVLREQTVQSEPIEKLLASLPAGKRTVYEYRTPQGRLYAAVLRADTPEGKTIRQCRAVGNGFVWGGPKPPHQLYNAPAVLDAERVYFVEGEKAANALTYFGFTATTTLGGASQPHLTDLSILDNKHIVLWADNDEAGEKYIDEIQDSLSGRRLRSLSRIQIDTLDLPRKGDAYDYIAKLWKMQPDHDGVRAVLQAITDEAASVSVRSPVDDMLKRMRSVVDGTIETIPLMLRQTSNATRALRPGTVTLICGNPGASKSLMVLEQLVAWHNDGYPAACWMLEDDRTFHLNRIMAQLECQSGLTDDEWCKNNAEYALSVPEKHRDILSRVGYEMRVSDNELPVLDDVADWIENMAPSSRIIVVDPITAAVSPGQRSWESEKLFLQRVKNTAKNHGSSVLFVTHPMKLISQPDLSQLAGSASYGRASHTALWLESHKEKLAECRFDIGRQTVNYNRTLHILKSRNGKGQGCKIACYFDPQSLRIKEYGVILKELKNEEAMDWE